MLKKIIVCLMSFLLILNSTLTNAYAIRQWGVSNPMAVGSSILYDGLKGVVTSSVLITPNATQIAKVLGTGGAGFALSYAVEQLLGAVDWVLDPENNQIRYKKIQFPCGPNNICNTADNITYYYYYDYSYSDHVRKYTTPLAACNALRAKYGGMPIISTKLTSDNLGPLHLCIVSETDSYQHIARAAVNNYPEKLPLKTVAQKVIENAENNNLDAQFAVLAAANNILAEAEQDDTKAKLIEDELENNAKCPSGIVRNGSCWICDKSQFMPITRATRDAKTATRGKSCKNVTDTAIKNANATLFRNLINARTQENVCWSPPDPNHAIALVDAQNALSLCEN